MQRITLRCLVCGADGSWILPRRSMRPAILPVAAHVGWRNGSSCGRVGISSDPLVQPGR